MEVLVCIKEIKPICRGDILPVSDYKEAVASLGSFLAVRPEKFRVPCDHFELRELTRDDYLTFHRAVDPNDWRYDDHVYACYLGKQGRAITFDLDQTVIFLPSRGELPAKRCFPWRLRFNELSQPKLCNCDMITLLRMGCQCGGT